jgi:hypothetical protein
MVEAAIMGWAVRVAPGVRVALTPRGVRTSVGPRGARVHFGAGRPTISTGAGPVTLWTGVRRSSRRRPTRSVAVHERQLRAAGRVAQLHEAQALEAAFSEHFVRVHLQQFPPAQPPVVPPPQPVNEEALRAAHEKRALDGVSWFKRSQRRVARERAHLQAAAEAATKRQAAQAEHDREQAQADEQWQRLLANDQQTVVATLEAAFEHSQMPAAALACDGAHATVLVRFPPVEGVVPAQRAAVTPTGRPTVRARTKGESNRLYAAAVLSHSLAVGREALAACPRLDDATIIVVTGGEDATSPVAAISAIRIDRGTLERIDWSAQPDAATAALGFERLMLLKGQAAELSPLSLVDEDALRDVVQQVAQHLGVPVDPRCEQPLRPGQVQHLAPAG